MKTVQVNIRLTSDEAKAIDKFIETGDFDNRVEFIRYAVKKVIKAYNGRISSGTIADDELLKNKL